MNPVEFLNNGCVEMLKAHENQKCCIRLLGQYGPIYEGMFIGVSLCKENELQGMAGFCIDVPIYKICVMVDNLPEHGIVPLWINTLLIDDINDIQFIG